MRFIELCKKRGSYEFEPFEKYQTLISFDGIKYSELMKYKDDLDSKYGVYLYFQSQRQRLLHFMSEKLAREKVLSNGACISV